MTTPRDGGVSTPPSNASGPRVLQVMGSLDVGGAEMMILSAAEQLAGRCTMDFLVFGEHKGKLEGRAREVGGQVLRMSAPKEVGPARFVRQLTSLLRAARYDAVHSHINLGSGLVMQAARTAAVPVRVAHSHTTTHSGRTAARRLYRRISQELIWRNATVFAACGEEAGRNLFGRPWHGEGGTVVPNGVDVDSFLDARNGRGRIRTELRIDDGTRLIGMVARLMPFKNHDFMLDMIARDRQRGGTVMLLVVGDGPLRVSLEERARELGVAEHVRFLGLREDVPSLLGALDVLAMPSLYEGLPVSLIEAQAAGVPAVISDQVSAESDLGLGLVTRLPLDDTEGWHQALHADPSRPTAEEVSAVFTTTGYDVRSSAERLLQLYRDRRSSL